MTYRHLYVPTYVSWDAQMDKANKIAKHDDTEKVIVHNHGYSEQCGSGGDCVTIEGSGVTTGKDQLSKSI